MVELNHPASLMDSSPGVNAVHRRLVEKGAAVALKTRSPFSFCSRPSNVPPQERAERPQGYHVDVDAFCVGRTA